MNYKLGIAFVICLIILFSTPVSSKSSDFDIDVYYNDQLYPGASTPKPLLKIGEPFKLRFEMTCYKKNFLSVMLTSISEDDFDIIEGPTPSLGTGTRGTIEANETRVFEWIVAPNEEWAGGSAPIDFFYQMTDLETKKVITSGRFTAAYVTISEEYHDGPEIMPDDSDDQSSSPTTPTFTALAAVFALVVAIVLRKE